MGSEGPALPAGSSPGLTSPDLERTAGLEPATSALGTPCAASCATSALLSRPVSRVLSPAGQPGDGHLSRAAVAGGLKRPTCEHGAGSSLAFWACSGRGLPSQPGYPGCWWSLLRHRFTLTPWRGRSAFCCTCPRVTPGRRYRPPCPAEPGLSSAPSRGRRGRPAGSGPAARYRRAGVGGEDPARCLSRSAA